jgi:tetratricopeptide (TPR) repeat protein
MVSRLNRKNYRCKKLAHIAGFYFRVARITPMNNRIIPARRVELNGSLLTPNRPKRVDQIRPYDLTCYSRTNRCHYPQPRDSEDISKHVDRFFKVMRASRASEEALQIFRDLAQKNPEAYLPDVATTLSNLGVLNRDQKQMEEARKELDETVQIRRELVQKNPEAYLPDVAETLNNIGGALSQAKPYARGQAGL